MTLACLMGRHARVTSEVRNQGLAFSRCRKCRRDLVHSGRGWRSVPRGFRVVWRRPAVRRRPLDAAQLLLDLPSTQRALVRLPAPRRFDRSRAFTQVVATLVHLLRWRMIERFRRKPAAIIRIGPVSRLPAS